MPEEKLAESLSGARFTRKGREAQIYVVHKIAQLLEDRGKLNNYRKPVTKALQQYRNLCMDHYPGLSEHCSELIIQFGEPRYMQIARNFGRSGKKAIHQVRRMLGLLKKRVLAKIRDGKSKSVKQGDKKNYEEIRYGLDTYQKTRKEGKKGELKKPSNPEISVVLPLQDDAVAFNKSFHSVLNQEYENFEVIVTGSKRPENLKSEVENFGDFRIRFVSSENNGDLATLRNQGLKEVKGDFVAFLDPGDEWHPAKLARQAEHFQKAPEDVGLVYSGSEFVDGQGEKTKILPVAKGYVYKKLLHQNIINCSSTVMIRRTVIPSIGFFDPHLPGFENHDYWLRISRFFKFEFLVESLVQSHTIYGGSRSHNTDNMNHEIEEKFFNKLQKGLEREGIDRKFAFKKM